MKKIVLGIVAHVDSGKTTLSEGMLYEGGIIRQMGRVDSGNSFLDTDETERSRGITIYASQAQFPYGETEICLLDTPGHVDFSAETERALQVLDYALLLINASDGVQGHTITLWKLLKRYQVPVFLFFNKMDRPEADAQALLHQVKNRLSEYCVDFSDTGSQEFMEEAAMTGEAAMEEFLESGILSDETIRRQIAERRLFPCFFGSALKHTGIEELLRGLDRYTGGPVYSSEFGARIYKISRDEAGNRLTHMKITGGVLKVKTALPGTDDKIDQIRIYNGAKYTTVTEVQAGGVCAVTGLKESRPGDVLGVETRAVPPVLEPVLTYRLCLPEGVDAAAMLPKIRQLEEEAPELHVVWNEALKEIHLQMMGQVQLEIIQGLVKDRYGVEVTFGDGSIVYRETIAAPVIGIGHFEPLRHYAEVHLLMEPGDAGSGVQAGTLIGRDELAENWQRLIMTHIREREHKGVLTGAPITDIKISLIAGRAHLKHTEGGDFRQAVYRAVRQGLMQADSVLLEPWYAYRLEIPAQMIGRAMADIERMHGSCVLSEHTEKEAVLEGKVPAASLSDYPREVAAYTSGQGRLSYVFDGYAPCHNTEEVLSSCGYLPEEDLENTADSVFCAHGAGFLVPWDRVGEYCHLESNGIAKPDDRSSDERETEGYKPRGAYHRESQELVIGTDEIDAILNRTMYANRKGGDKKAAGEPGWKHRKNTESRVIAASGKPGTDNRLKDEYLLVDGYNVIFAWEELSELAKDSIDGARGRLLDILCNYQGIRQCELIVVFDAYRAKGHDTEILDYHNIHVVYTKEAETADQYIEKFAHENARRYRVTVVTSDGLEQIIIRGEGCGLISSREFETEVRLAGERLREDYLEQKSESLGRLEKQIREAIEDQLE